MSETNFSEAKMSKANFSEAKTDKAGSGSVKTPKDCQHFYKNSQAKYCPTAYNTQV
ncbi:hypothetical protein L4G92_02060 [Neisseria sp. ZJ106]|uniref:Uncharacterized protein n=1 Tax=Neisseria lisongii TaxID=2912188 RepID=A0ABY7RGY6_9NEIS|nr:hypothetical protein [Neisseria lisongii]MCF7520837.1 hypothetical protein [Neisseria lisongii]WCL70772.1 hypothetical protein PJU73_05130 [Neisseria lisongii]